MERHNEILQSYDQIVGEQVPSEINNTQSYNEPNPYQSTETI